MEISTTQEILLFRLMLCAIVLFLAQHMLSYCLLIHLCACQKYPVILLELHLFEAVKESF